ncbi:MAG TPA: hypothetical protein VFO00_01625 [Vitreimonas sp.]|nr:hypothetical protein [Vitreimonas sp.]
MGLELFYFIGAIVLLVAIGYGVASDKSRDKRKDALTEAATREQYQHPERYQKTQKQFEDATKD